MVTVGVKGLVVDSAVADYAGEQVVKWLIGKALGCRKRLGVRGQCMNTHECCSNDSQHQQTDEDGRNSHEPALCFSTHDIEYV